MRKRRKYSKSGFYHIVIRGVNKQNIFFDEADKKLFLGLLKKYSIKLKIQVHAYCLMDNHAHLLLEDTDKSISLFMQVFTSLYARLFNKKYDRIGHLFQERFASEVIEDSFYFMTVFRYIIQNPEKAGIEKTENYEWSSFKLYKVKDTFLEKETVLSLFPSLEAMYDFLKIKNNDICLEIELRPSEKEQHYIQKIKEILQTDNPLILQNLSRQEIEQQIKKLKAAKISTRTIARITCIPRALIQKV